MEQIITILISVIISGGLVYVVTSKLTPKQRKTPEKASKEENEARARSQELIIEAKNQALDIKSRAEEESLRLKQEGMDIQRKGEAKEQFLKGREEEITKRENDVTSQQRGVSKKLEELEETKRSITTELEKVASMTRKEAEALLLSQVESGLKEEISKKIKEAEETAKLEADSRAVDIVVSSLQRVGTDYVSQTTTSRVKLADDDIKGRIIGREGRNIKALEQATGVTFDLDETPQEVRLSCFDPVRREIAKIALERLITDGRIQPARIEEFVEHAKKDVEIEMRKAGEQLAYDVGVHHLPSDIIDLLGRFKFRTSYGQNLASHTLEVVRLASAMSSELKIDVELTKKAALLHDIGKVQTAEQEGPHAQLTRKILEKYHFDEKLINAAAAHHEEEEFKSPEAVIIHLADALSGSRPGARFEDYEAFVKRMHNLEEAAFSFSGVEKAFAISAGREVRVIVEPKEIDDAGVIKLAHELAQKIEKEQTYPGTVKVTIIRELRSSDTAK